MPGRGRQSLPAAPHPSLLRFPARCLLVFAQAPAKLLLSRAPPGLCDEIAALRCLHARLQRRPRGRATLARHRRALALSALPHLPIAPGNREGGTPKGTARASRHPDILFTVADRLGATLT